MSTELIVVAWIGRQPPRASSEGGLEAQASSYFHLILTWMDALSREAARFSIRINSLKERICSYRANSSFKSWPYLRKASLCRKTKSSYFLNVRRGQIWFPSAILCVHLYFSKYVCFNKVLGLAKPLATFAGMVNYCSVDSTGREIVFPSYSHPIFMQKLTAPIFFT